MANLWFTIYQHFDSQTPLKEKKKKTRERNNITKQLVHTESLGKKIRDPSGDHMIGLAKSGHKPRQKKAKGVDAEIALVR